MLYLNTVTPLLKSTLETLMHADVFWGFRLVGGTSLSLQIGHRMSDDIDLFTDATYGSLDFKKIDAYLKEAFPYAESFNVEPIGMGKSYSVGDSDNAAVKLDVYYTDTFIREPLINSDIRMGTLEEIIAMKIDIIQRGGRKKDFWDLHELSGKYSLGQMIALHKERYPYAHNADLIVSNFKNFEKADGEFDPICLKGKYWEVIKSDMTEIANKFRQNN